MDNYRVEGNGNTIELAEKSLDQAKDNLLKKLESKNITTALSLARTVYIGSFELKEKYVNGLRPDSFKIESEKDWKEVIDKASRNVRKACSLDEHYASNYSIEQYLALTKEQKDALSSSRPPAGRESRGYSIEDHLRN